jgi:hypothetical protein
MSSIWEWIAQYEAHALARGNREAVRLARLHSEAYSHRQDNPQHMLALLREGRELALHLHEPWWVAFFEHWQIETLIYYLDDYRHVLDRVIALTLELQKPVFEAYPLRFGIYCNLVAAYLCIDPRGYAPAIQQALDYLGSIVPSEGGDRYLLQARRHWFAYELGRYDEAQRLAQEELAMADADSDRHTALHHEVDTYKALCWIAFRQENWDELELYAELGEQRARDIGYRYELALFLMWRALTAQRQGNAARARGFYRTASGIMTRLGQPPGESYYDAIARFQEESGHLEAAWEAREQEWHQIRDKGQLAYEAQVCVKRVRLLRLLNKPIEQETTRARAAIARLRAPQWYLDELDRARGS